MTLETFLLLLLIAGVCGAIAQSITGYDLGGILVTIVIGFIGALLGTWLAGVLGLPELFTLRIGRENFPLLWSIIGATVFTALIGSFSSRRTVYYRR